jgi:hypothetical protein
LEECQAYLNVLNDHVNLNAAGLELYGYPDNQDRASDADYNYYYIGGVIINNNVAWVVVLFPALEIFTHDMIFIY